MNFQIGSRSFDDFMQAYHSDVCNREEWGGGNIEKADGSLFFRTAEGVWGLGGPPKNYRPYENGIYYFVITSEDRFHRSGIERFGSTFE